MRLCDVENLKCCVLSEIRGLEIAKHKRLVELGFVQGTKIEILKNSRKAKTMVIGIRGYTISIDYLLAENIFVWGK